jgi:hypothetical protein
MVKILNWMAAMPIGRETRPKLPSTYPGEGRGVGVQVHQEVLAPLVHVPAGLHVGNIHSVTHWLHEGRRGARQRPKDSCHTPFQEPAHCNTAVGQTWAPHTLHPRTPPLKCSPVCDTARLSCGGARSGRAPSFFCRTVRSELMVSVVYWNTSSSWTSVLWNSPPESH